MKSLGRRIRWKIRVKENLWTRSEENSNYTVTDTDRQTPGQTDRETKTDKQTDRETQTDTKTVSQTDRRTYSPFKKCSYQPLNCCIIE